MKIAWLVSGMVSTTLSGAAVGGPLGDRVSEVHRRFLDERRDALGGMSDPFGVPCAARVVMEQSQLGRGGGWSWKRNVVATVFWVGEQPSEHNPTPNHQSAWDPNWQVNFGGVDQPDRRDGWCPEGFTPMLSPFYVALPYNDVTQGGVHRPEAAVEVPWFWEAYRGDGISVCKDRWLAIHHAGRVCYAQWEDVGPFEVDHWQYVFGQEVPRSNRNQAAGIDLSPAVRDFLALRSGGQVEWRFVNDRDVPPGPWRNWTTHAPLSVH